MGSSAALPAKYLLVADAVAIVLGLVLLYEYVGFGGTSIIGYICIPIFTLLVSLGLWMWANGAGANLVSAPGWEKLDDDEKERAVSIMGFHIAAGMTIVCCAMPCIFIPRWGIAAFIILLLAGMAFTFLGIVRICMKRGHLASGPSHRPPLTVWTTVLIMLFAIVAVPVTVLTESGPDGVIVDLGDSELSIRAPMVDRTVAYSDISSLELDSDLDIGSRISGMEDLKLACGKYRNSEFGTYTLASYKSCDTYIVLRTNDGSVLVFNQSDNDDTSALYNDIKGRM